MRAYARLAREFLTPGTRLNAVQEMLLVYDAFEREGESAGMFPAGLLPGIGTGAPEADRPASAAPDGSAIEWRSDPEEFEQVLAGIGDLREMAERAASDEAALHHLDGKFY